MIIHWKPSWQDKHQPKQVYNLNYIGSAAENEVHIVLVDPTHAQPKVRNAMSMEVMEMQTSGRFHLL